MDEAQARRNRLKALKERSSAAAVNTDDGNPEVPGGGASGLANPLIDEPEGNEEPPSSSKTFTFYSDPLAACHKGTTATAAASASSKGTGRLHHPAPPQPLPPPPGMLPPPPGMILPPHPHAPYGPPPPGPPPAYLPPPPPGPGPPPPFHGPLPGHLPPPPGPQQYYNNGRYPAKVPRRDGPPHHQRHQQGFHQQGPPPPQQQGRGGRGRGGGRGGGGRGGGVLFKQSMVEDPWAQLMMAAKQRGPPMPAAHTLQEASAWSDEGNMDRPWH